MTPFSVITILPCNVLRPARCMAVSRRGSKSPLAGNVVGGSGVKKFFDRVSHDVCQALVVGQSHVLLWYDDSVEIGGHFAGILFANEKRACSTELQA